MNRSRRVLSAQIQNSMLKLLHKDATFVARIISTKLFSTSSTNGVEQKWRRERGLPENPNKELLLINTPDYSFVDGRPTPIGARQKKRLIKQREYAEKIVKLSQEIDFAAERYERLKVEKEEQRKAIINRKLKPKGAFQKQKNN